MFPKIRYILHEEKEPVRFEIDLTSEGLGGCTVEYERLKRENNGQMIYVWVARVRGMESIIQPAMYTMETNRPDIKRIAERGLQELYVPLKELQSAIAELDVYFTDVLSPTLNITDDKKKKSFINNLNELFK